MARPKKQTVDYFPHICRHGKTMFILEQKFGNDGYAFWFKLLELLGDTEGHHIDCNNPATWEFLQSKTHLPEDTCETILKLLARLDAIDSELWENRIIWSENFIKGLAPVYQNRRVEIPPKPSFYNQKPKPAEVSTTEKPQRRGEESRVEKKDAQPKNPACAKNVFDSPYFLITEDWYNQLQTDYPGLSPPHLLKEIKKAADWLSDNPNRHKKKSNGKMANPRVFLRNWLDKVQVPAETQPDPKMDFCEVHPERPYTQRVGGQRMCSECAKAYWHREGIK